MKLTKSQDNKLTRLFESFWSILPSGQGARIKKGIARTAFDKQMKKVSEAEWEELTNKMKESMIAQEAYRSRITRDYPDERSRRNNGVFLPSRPHPSSWINGERWNDEVRKVSDPVKVLRDKCMECPLDGTHLVEGGSVCDWHWTKKFDPDHLRMLYNNLKSMGLGIGQEETKAEWSNRCRAWLKNHKMGKALGA